MKKPDFRTIAIIGVGLIGGSMGLAIRNRFSTMQVLGVDTPEILRKAMRLGAIDRGVRDMRAAIRAADLVILATPVGTILRILPSVARAAGTDILVTDVGSVKEPVVRKAASLFPAGNFVGGHPMAGVEQTGIGAAHPLLFENAVYVLTPLAGRVRGNAKRFAVLAEGLGARTLIMGAREHDEVAAAVSHMPQLVAVALMNVAGRQHPVAPTYLQLAAGGFRDLTRIASSSYELWSHILPANKTRTSRALDLVIRELRKYRIALRTDRRGVLQSSFTSARRLRNNIPRDMKGFLHNLATVQVFVPDRPGMLARITAALSARKINIKDIELMKVREGTGGTFRLSFATQEEAEKASAVLRRKGFEIAG